MGTYEPSVGFGTGSEFGLEKLLQIFGLLLERTEADLTQGASATISMSAV